MPEVRHGLVTKRVPMQYLCATHGHYSCHVGVYLWHDGAMSVAWTPCYIGDTC